MRATHFVPLLALLTTTAVACGGAERPSRVADNGRTVTTLRVLKAGDVETPVPAETTPQPITAPTVNTNTFLKISPAKPVAAIDVAAWRARWPAAAKDLEEWGKTYPVAHAKVREWDAKGDRFECFVEWAIAHPYESFHAFLMSRRGWSQNEETLAHPQQHPAMDAFMNVVRRSQTAFLELAHQPNGYAWLENHPDTGKPGDNPNTPPPQGMTNMQPADDANTAPAPSTPPAKP